MRNPFKVGPGSDFGKGLLKSLKVENFAGFRNFHTSIHPRKSQFLYKIQYPSGWQSFLTGAVTTENHLWSPAAPISRYNRPLK